MENNVVFRSFKKGDYETVCEWWKWWWGSFGAEPIRRGFLPKDEKLIIAIFFISITALIICPLSISVWAAFGTGIRNLVKNYKKKAIVEYFLAILLLITAILIVIEK